MAGILKVDKYQDFNGNDIMTSDGSGNITLNNAALKMTPAFQAYIGTQQSISTSTVTKIAYDTEIFDTDNMYDATTNYRFTPTVAGKYLVYARYRISSGGERDQISIYKNGSEFARSTQNGPSQLTSSLITEILTLNGSTDYIEAYAWHNNGSTQHLDEGTSPHYSTFGAYKLIGV